MGAIDFKRLIGETVQVPYHDFKWTVLLFTRDKAEFDCLSCPQLWLGVIFDADASILSSFITARADVSLQPIRMAA